jgi:hypothetical protein
MNRPHADLENPDAALSGPELRAIGELQRLARRWPHSLTLVSMDGNLHVIRTGDPRYHSEGRDGAQRQESVIADIDGIPNDGGAW